MAVFLTMARGLPATRAGTETAILMGFVGWRIAVLAQMASGVPHGVDVSPHPGWYVTAALLATAGSAASYVAGIVRRRVIGPAWTGVNSLACTC